MELRLVKIVAPSGCCTLCRGPAAPLAEVMLPYGPFVATGGQIAQWWDLCPACISTLEAHPDPYVTLERPLPSLVPLVGSQREYEPSTRKTGRGK